MCENDDFSSPKGRLFVWKTWNKHGDFQQQKVRKSCWLACFITPADFTIAPATKPRPNQLPEVLFASREDCSSLRPPWPRLRAWCEHLWWSLAQAYLRRAQLIYFVSLTLVSEYSPPNSSKYFYLLRDHFYEWNTFLWEKSFYYREILLSVWEWFVVRFHLYYSHICLMIS